MRSQSSAATKRGWPDRFWDRVDRRQDGCWLWTGTTSSNGYGKVRLPPPGRRQQSTHRVAWELTHGAIADGLWVLHRCDTPQCVNPDHLFLGTVTDNVHDMMAKGRQRFTQNGEAHGMAKLTADDVREMRALYAAGGLTSREIGERFGVVQQAAMSAIQGKTWSHIEGAVTQIRTARPQSSETRVKKSQALKAYWVRKRAEKAATDPPPHRSVGGCRG